MMKLRFHCVNKLSDKHDKDIDLTDLILWPWPTCCGADMIPVDEAEWRRISKVLGRVNVELQQAGLPTLAGMLYHTAGRPVLTTGSTVTAAPVELSDENLVGGAAAGEPNR